MTWDVMVNRFSKVAGPLPNTFDYLDMHGYELMMASYAVAHLKISFKLAETGCELSGGAASRLHVYLTNSLDAPSKAQSELEGISPALAAEARAVATPLTVAASVTPLGE